VGTPGYLHCPDKGLEDGEMERWRGERRGSRRGAVQIKVTRAGGRER